MSNPNHTIGRSWRAMQAFMWDDTGSVYVEFGIILPVLVFLILGMIEIGLALNAKAAIGRATSDGIDILADMPAGRLDTWSPASADGIKVAEFVGSAISAYSDSWKAVAEEYTAGAGFQTISSAEGGSACELPPQLTAASMAGFGLAAGERVAVLRTCLDVDGMFSDMVLGPHHFSETRILPMRRPVPVSCRELYAFGETRDGIYRIDPDAAGGTAPILVRCDMGHGGWTLVAAQFEADPALGWDNVNSGSYDPTLASHESFALNQSQLPPHGETAFGLNIDATAVERFDMTYGTAAEVDLPAITGASGFDYDLYRSDLLAQPDLDPESGATAPAPTDRVSCMVLDRTGTAGFDWAFCPNASDPDKRGAAMGGVDRRSTSDAAAWTIWVR